MSFMKLIQADYKEWLELNKATLPDGMYRALKSNERIPLFFQNLEREIAKVQFRKKVILDRIVIKNIVYDMTNAFVTLLKRQADEKGMSILERSRLVSVSNKKLSITDEVASEYKAELIRNGVIEKTGE